MSTNNALLGKSMNTVRQGDITGFDDAEIIILEDEEDDRTNND